MKTQYRKVKKWWFRQGISPRYELEHGGYHRSINTWSEIRQNEWARDDIRQHDYTYKVRARRNYFLLDSWNDFNISRNYGRSWKDYTRNRNQYDKTPHISEDTPALGHMTRFIYGACDGE